MFLPLAAGLGLLLVGCASPRGPKYSESADSSATAPAGQSLVFLLRTPNIVDSANSWIVGLNGVPLVVVPNGGYHIFTNAPGTLRFATRVGNNILNVGLLTLFNKEREVLRMDVQPDTTCYLQLFCGQLTELPPDKGREALAKCRKIIPATPDTAPANDRD